MIPSKHFGPSASVGLSAQKYISFFAGLEASLRQLVLRAPSRIPFSSRDWFQLSVCGFPIGVMPGSSKVLLVSLISPRRVKWAGLIANSKPREGPSPLLFAGWRTFSYTSGALTSVEPLQTTPDSELSPCVLRPSFAFWP